ncbi:MAG: Protein containing Heat shock protein Hsp20 protein [Parcubacteria group bacterium GW2011_GWA2_47_21]|nr:MAG: Protein containing Heat shock protein Hsp20 protein [Parcubacteria group bacterium GW2011_GWA2_47_21]
MAKDKRSFFERLTGAGAEELEDEKELSVSQNLSPLSDSDDEAGELAVDVYQTADNIIIKAMVAGIKPDDLDIAITRDMVTIKGTRESDREANDENFFFKELYWGSFSRTILLPQEVEVEEAEASEKNGLLTIKLPKVDKGRQTKLKVRSSS